MLCVIACNAQDKKEIKRGIADYSYGFPGTRISSRFGDPGFGPGLDSGLGGYQGMSMGFGSPMGMGYGGPIGMGGYAGQMGGFGGPMGMGGFGLPYQNGGVYGGSFAGGYPGSHMGGYPYRGFGGTPYNPIMSPSYPGQVVGPQLSVNGLGVGY